MFYSYGTIVNDHYVVYLPGCIVVKYLLASEGDARDVGLILEQGRSPEEGKGNPFQNSCLEIPWTEEPGGLQSLGLQKVGHDLVTEHDD